MKQYYYIYNDQQQGPCSAEEIRLLHLDGATLVWSEGWEEWKKLQEVDELAFEQTRPYTPQPSQQPVVSSSYDSYGVQEQQEPAGDEVPPIPKNHMASAITITVLAAMCCIIGSVGTGIAALGSYGIGLVVGCFLIVYIPALVCGIVAVIKGNSVNKYYMYRQYGMAEAASKSAKKWVVAGRVFTAIYLILQILSVLIPVLFFGATFAAISSYF